MLAFIRHVRGAGLPTLVSIALLVIPPAASAAWLSPQIISPTNGQAGARGVVADAHGDALAVWQFYDGAHDTVETASRVAGGVWQAPQVISQSNENATQPDVVMDPQGDAAGTPAEEARLAFRSDPF